MHKHSKKSLDALPELTELEIAALLECRGLDAFTPCEFPIEIDQGAGGSADSSMPKSAILKFRYGFLKLVRGVIEQDGIARNFVSVDFHDYRAALFNFHLTSGAYQRLETIARRRLRDARVGQDSVTLACCEEQGYLYASVEALAAMPDERPLVEFLTRYFGSSLVLSDLNHVFGEAAIAYAKSHVYPLVESLAT
jgi:hypothetical protein